MDICESIFNIMNEAELAVFEVDREGLFTFVNDVGARKLGFSSPFDLIGKRYIWEFIAEGKTMEEKKKICDEYNRLLEREGKLSFEIRVRAVDGREFWVLVNEMAVFDEKGNIVKKKGFAFDVEEWKRLKKGLEEVKWFFDKILEMVPSMRFKIDLDGKILYVDDEGTKRIFGYSSAEEMIGKNVWEFHFDAETGKHFHKSLIDGLKRTREIAVRRVLLRKADGTPFWALSMVRGLYDNEGKLTGREGVLLDIDAFTGEERLKMGVEYKSRLLSVLMHEIKTPLASITGFLELLAETQLDPLQSEYLKMAMSGVNEALGMVNNLLEAFKIEEGKVRVFEVPFFLEELVMEILQVVRSLLKEGVELRLNIKKIPFYLIGDSYKLKQILLNLMSNSAKFTERGFIELGVSKVVEKGNKVEITFCVKDTGIGIPEDEKDKVFVPFFQLESGAGKGSGLGLYITKSFVSLMGGDIWFESFPGKGTTFFVRLPFKKGSVRVSSSDLIRGKNFLLLIRADEIKSLVRDVLEEEGGVFLEASTCKEALEAALERGIDCLIGEIIFDGKDVFDVFEQIKRILGRRDLKLLVITEFPKGVPASRGGSCLLSASKDVKYLFKPFTREELVESLKKLLSMI